MPYHGKEGAAMREIARSKLTAKEQLTVPAAIRKMLGVEAGDELVWKRNDDGDVVVQPARKNTLEDIRAALRAAGVPKWEGPPVSVEEMKEGIARHLRKKHGRR